MRATHLTLIEFKRKIKEKRKEKEKENGGRKREERETPPSLYDLRRSGYRRSTSQGLKSGYEVRTTH